MPKTKLGRWSIGLILAMFILFIIGLSLPNILYESAPSSNTFLDDIVNRPLLALSMLAGVSAGISALITGLVALLKRKERAILVYGSTLVGGAVTLFVISMFLFPD
jgi:hypothetical protein